ncbi:hypothetical protein J1N35_028034 [Gossypium stocksii]|uniref:Uncharacterized protein n=1 Tax=Gossypium stocksii TaxID=47602 RepID=A0A9D3UV66_9ROSI|nr:hypothetical protein J1N35_028034 [Gossypium stocksii]
MRVEPSLREHGNHILNISTVLTSIRLLLSEPNPDYGLMCEAQGWGSRDNAKFSEELEAIMVKREDFMLQVGSKQNGLLGMQMHSSMEERDEDQDERGGEDEDEEDEEPEPQLRQNPPRN